MKYLYLGQLADGVESAEYLSHAISIMTRGREGSEGAGGGCVRSEGEEGAGGRCESSEGVMLAQGGEERVSDEDISRAYCSLAEVYLTDAWYDTLTLYVLHLTPFSPAVLPVVQRKSATAAVERQ